MNVTRANPNLKNSAGSTPLHVAVEYFQKDAIQFASNFNCKVRKSQSESSSGIHLFDFNVNSRLHGTVYHQACKIPSLSLILTLTSSPDLDPLALDNTLKLGSQLIEQSYMGSKKLSLKSEISAFLATIKTPLCLEMKSRHNYSKRDESNYVGEHQEENAVKKRISVHKPLKLKLFSKMTIDPAIQMTDTSRQESSMKNDTTEELGMDMEEGCTSAYQKQSMYSKESLSASISKSLTVTKNHLKFINPISANKISLSKKPPPQPKLLKNALNVSRVDASSLNFTDSFNFFPGTKPLQETIKNFQTDLSNFDKFTIHSQSKTSLKLEQLLVKVVFLNKDTEPPRDDFEENLQADGKQFRRCGHRRTDTVSRP